MYQKDLIRSAWKSAGLYDEKDSKLQQFLGMLDDPTQCWNELSDACRRSYAAYKTKLVQPILGTGDKLVHLMLIRTSTESNDDEMSMIEQYVASSDPVRDQIELKAVALKNIPRLNAALTKRPDLTADLRGIIAAQAATAPAPTVTSTAPPPAVPTAATPAPPAPPAPAG